MGYENLLVNILIDIFLVTMTVYYLTLIIVEPSALTITDVKVTTTSVNFMWEFDGFAESIFIEVVYNSGLVSCFRYE